MGEETRKNKQRKIIKWIGGILLLLISIVFIIGGHMGFNLGIDASKSTTEDLDFGNDQANLEVMARLDESEEVFNHLNYEVMNTESDDGLKLTGYFVPANDQTSKRLVVIPHGFSMKAKNVAVLLN